MGPSLSSPTEKKRAKTSTMQPRVGLSKPPIDIPNLVFTQTGSRVSVLGRIMRLAQEKTPKGLWIELEEAGEGVGLWLPEAVAKGVKSLQLNEGDIVIGTGAFTKEDGPLLGTIDVRNSSDIIPLR